MFGKMNLIRIPFLLMVLCVCALAQQNSPLKTEPKIESDEEVEYQKRAKRITENNLKVQTFLTEGINAFQNKKFDSAIEKFDEALKIESDHWGTSTVILTNKAKVLRMIGIKKYNEAARNYWNPAIEANPFFNDAVISLNRALQIFSDTPVETAEANRSSFEHYKFNTLKELAECYRLIVLTDKTRTDEAIKAFEDYISVEPDELKKEKALRELNKLQARK